MANEEEVPYTEVKSEPIPLSSLRPKEESKETVSSEKVSEIEVDPNKKSSDNKQNFSIKDTSFIKDFIKKPTNPSISTSTSPSSAPKSNETVEDIRRRLEVEEKEEVSKLSVEDFEDAAEFIIDVLDMSLVFVIRWYSQDISDAEYKVPEEKLKKLKKHLSRLLMRMGKKFPMGMLFILGVLAAYATPVRKAYSHRKNVQAEKVRKRLDKNIKKETSSEFELEDAKPEYIPLKKKRGGNAK